MNFHYWDLGQQPRGAVVEVRLSGNAANVRLLDRSNFSASRSLFSLREVPADGEGPGAGWHDLTAVRATW